MTLAKGNPVFLRDPFEMSADSIFDLGEKVADMFFELGVEVTGVNAVYRGDIEQKWEREPEKPNLFNGNGKDQDASNAALLVSKRRKTMNDTNDTTEDRERKSSERIKTAFEAWMDKPMTRMCVSMIPANEQQPEALLTLLKSTFEAGFQAGQGHMAGEFAQLILKRSQNPQNPRP